MADTLRRSNWPAQETSPRRSQLDPRPPHDEDPLAELERLVARGGPFTSREPPPVQQPPSNVAPFPYQSPPGREPAARTRIEPSPDPEQRALERALGAGRRPATPSAPQELDAEFLRGLDREIFGEPVDEARPHGASDAYAVEPSPDDGASEPPVEPEPRPRQRGGFTTIVAVIGLVVIGFGGAIAYALMTRGGARSGVEPVIVRADERPTRVVPPPAPQANSEANDRLIFERGAAPAARAPGERVVSREEQPVEMPQRPDVRAATPGGLPQGAEPPRRVTTTTIRVRPDGTLESEPTRPPVSTAAPAARGPDAAPAPLAAVPPAALAPPPSAALAPPPSAAAPPQQAPAQPAPPIAAAAPATPPAAAAAPVPRPAPPRPANATANDAPVPLNAAPQRTAAAEPAARARAPSGSYVQLTSQRSEAAARTAFGDIARRYSSIIGSRQADIRRVDLGERGTFYRARVGGFASRDEAAQFCTRLRTAGGACVLATN